MGETYVAIRQKFVEISGRYDLVDPTTWEDNGADFFLNAGQKWLDRQLDTNKMFARYPVSLAIGEFIAKSAGVRAIKEVWIENLDGRWELVPSTLQSLRSTYDLAPSNETVGTPEYYAPALLRPYPDSTAYTGLYDIEDLLVANNHYTYNGVVIMPPTDKVCTLTIFGLFYSPALSATLAAGVWTQTKSYWTEVHPDTLIAAALYRLNMTYPSHKTTADGYKEQAIDDIFGIDKDAVAEMLAGDSVMGG